MYKPILKFAISYVTDPASVSSSSSSSSRSSSSSASSGSNLRPGSVNSNSPNVITLDSPSPPVTPAIAHSGNSLSTPLSTSVVPPPAHSNSSSSSYLHGMNHNAMHSLYSMSSLPSLPILDLDSDSSSGSNNLRGSGYQF